MTPVVFIIGMLNLLLGFVLAVLLEKRIVVPLPSPRFQRAPDSDDVVFAFPLPSSTTPSKREQFPQHWRELLRKTDTQCNTIVEAAVELLTLEVAAYSEDLLDIEDRLRGAIDNQDADELRDAVQRLIVLNREWTSKQCDVVQVLAGKRDELGEYSEIGSRLESTLLDQSSLIEDRCAEMEKIDAHKDASAPATVSRCLGDMVRMAHELRDAMQATTLLIVRTEGRIASSVRQQRPDTLTGLPSRMDLEQVFENWWREDAPRSRLVSAALVDLDRFGEANARFGARAGDRILSRLAGHLQHLTSSDSGLDRAFRYSGQSFFLFYGGRGPREAARDAERVRQMIEATTFEYREQRFTLTVSAGVTQVRCDDDTARVCQRLEELSRAAKRAGGNRTCLEDASDSGVVQPEAMQVEQRVLRLEESPG